MVDNEATAESNWGMKYNLEAGCVIRTTEVKRMKLDYTVAQELSNEQCPGIASVNKQIFLQLFMISIVLKLTIHCIAEPLWLMFAKHAFDHTQDVAKITIVQNLVFITSDAKQHLNEQHLNFILSWQDIFVVPFITQDPFKNTNILHNSYYSFAAVQFFSRWSNSTGRTKRMDRYGAHERNS